MRATFIITIEGNWHHNDKKVTAARVEKELRRAIKDEFQFLASRVTVKRQSGARCAAAKEPGEEA